MKAKNLRRIHIRELLNVREIVVRVHKIGAYISEAVVGCFVHRGFRVKFETWSQTACGQPDFRVRLEEPSIHIVCDAATVLNPRRPYTAKSAKITLNLQMFLQNHDSSIQVAVVRLIRHAPS